MPKLSALDISLYFIQLASKIDENDLTNLKLQKLLYLAQGRYMAKTGKQLFSDQIEAWSLGPVVRTVYDTYKVCGAFPITAFDINVSDSNELSNDVRAFLDSIWEEYGKYSANYLVNFTHKTAPWNKAFEQGNNTVIDLAELKSFFEKE